MSQPTPYVRASNFANQQAVTPSAPLRGDMVDLELNLVKVSLDETQANLALIQRDDGAIKNQSIGFDQLKAELDGFGFNPPSEWLTATNYAARDTVFSGSGFYRSVASHISGVFADDLAAGKWALIADFTAAASESAASAASALVSQNAAAASATAADEDAAATAADRTAVATNKDLVDTAKAAVDAAKAAVDGAKAAVDADAAATAADRVATAEDRVQTGLDRAAAAASAASVGVLGINVMSMGAVADDTTDDTGIFVAAQALAIAENTKLVVVPAGKYAVNGPIDIQDEVTWLLLGCDIRTSNSVATIFSASSKRDWAVIGTGRLLGSRTGAETSEQHGIRIENCGAYLVSGIQVRNFQGKGIHVTGGSSVTPLYGERGRFSDLLVAGCTIGIAADAGAGAEYCTWSNCNVTDNDIGVEFTAGNHTWTGGTIADNLTGVYLSSGLNHGHGSFAGTNINHNVTYAIDGLDVTLGYTFTGCHVYGNGAAGEGKIRLTGCDRITFDGGILDADILNDTGTGAGYVYFRNMSCPGGYGKVDVTGTAAGKVVFLGNTGPGSYLDGSRLNDVSAVHALVYRGSVTQAISGATQLILPDEVTDKRSAYDTTTGVFKVPAGQGGIYRITPSLLVSGTGLMEAYIQVRLNGSTPVGVFLPSYYSTTLLRFSGPIEFVLLENDEITLHATVGGTSPVLGNDGYLSTLAFERVN